MKKTLLSVLLIVVLVLLGVSTAFAAPAEEVVLSPADAVGCFGGRWSDPDGMPRDVNITITSVSYTAPLQLAITEKFCVTVRNDAPTMLYIVLGVKNEWVSTPGGSPRKQAPYHILTCSDADSVETIDDWRVISPGNSAVASGASKTICFQAQPKNNVAPGDVVMFTLEAFTWSGTTSLPVGLILTVHSDAMTEGMKVTPFQVLPYRIDPPRRRAG